MLRRKREPRSVWFQSLCLFFCTHWIDPIVQLEELWWPEFPSVGGYPGPHLGTALFADVAHLYLRRNIAVSSHMATLSLATVSGGGAWGVRVAGRSSTVSCLWALPSPACLGNHHRPWHWLLAPSCDLGLIPKSLWASGASSGTVMPACRAGVRTKQGPGCQIPSSFWHTLGLCSRIASA